uniref:Reverse transcriptase domain-containing protein n=1 Tax=Sparus aurata TaxID=8175 RepID=A0A671TVT9_SPAAU
MASGKIKIISYNVNGLLNPIKRSKLLTKMRKEQAQIVYLQETHLDFKEHEKLKRMGFTSVFSSSYKAGRRRGVAILLSGKLHFEKILEISDREGRFILVRGNIEGDPVTLLNVYAPPGSDIHFFKRVVDMITSETVGLLICGGDLNIHLQPKLDTSNGKAQNTKSLVKKINILFEEVGLIDIWRDLHPNQRDFTHYSSPHSLYTRIDYFLTFGKDKDKINTCEIGTIDLSDHAPMYLSVDLNLQPKLNNWKLNSSLLNDPHFKEQMKREIHFYMEMNDKGDVSPPILWDALKAVLRGKIIAISSYKKKMRNKKMGELQNKLKELEKKHKEKTAQDLLEEIRKTRNEIDNLTTYEIKKNLMFLKQRYYEGGSKSMKVLAWKLKKRMAQNTIHNIKDPVTKTTKNKLNEILEAFETFYKTLYTKKTGGSIAEIDNFLDSLELPALNEEQNKILIDDITERELKIAISKLKSNKSPGSDGYTAEWYKELKEELIPVMLPTLNWALKKAQTPPSWKEAIISAIPKENKDKLECGSYRPISVLNIDYRLFTSIMARRLERFLPNLIHNDQTGFIRERQTQDNIRRMLQIINHIQKNKTAAMVISIDAEKAFDSVDWSFLYRVLHRFGLHETIIKTIQALYNNPTARIKVNGCLSNSFTLERGTRQGCACSPLLFALYLEPFSQYVRQNKEIIGVNIQGKVHKLACYADDILIFLGQPTNSLPKLMQSFEYFGQLSGYKININKTQLLKYNYSPPDEIKSKYHLTWETEYFKYLGVIIPKDLTELSQRNYSPIQKQIKEDIARWNLIPYLSFGSRIDSIKMNILPKLLYLFQTLPTELGQKQFNEWDKILSRYIWQGKKPRIRFKTLQLAKAKGGWGLPSLRDYYWAAQLRPLICWCNPSYDAQWKNIEEGLTSTPIQALIADSSLQDFIKNTENPWIRTTLKIWKTVITEYKLEEDIVILKWCAYDTRFAPNQLDTRFKEWTNKGLTALCKIIKENTLLSFEQIKDKYALEAQDFYRYLQLRHFVSDKLKYISESSKQLLDLFKRAYSSNKDRGIISGLYKGLINKKAHSSLYIKEKWEVEGGIDLTEEEWVTIWEYQWKCSSSQSWKEFGWKSLIRYFITPYQNSHYKGNSLACWRNFGSTNANHYHVFWDCGVIKTYWKGIHNAIKVIFGSQLPLESKVFFFGLVPEGWPRRDKYLFSILLVASKKALTKKWLSQESPTLTMWMDITMDICRMEKLTADVNYKKDLFVLRWKKWMNYITPLRPDFDLLNFK